MYNKKTQFYELMIDEKNAKFDVILDGCEFSALDVRSAVNQTSDSFEVIIDAEEHIPTLVSVEENGKNTIFTWESESSLWSKKIYTLECTPLRFIYKFKVFGHGKVDGVDYFSGNRADRACGSSFEFDRGFIPLATLPYEDDYWFKSSEKCSRLDELMIPPMFCYAFSCQGITKKLMLGLIAEKGEHNFHRFIYDHSSMTDKGGGFFLSTDQHGHTSVDGEWTAPYIIGYGDEEVFEGLRKYSDFYFSSGIAAPKKNALVPKFWHGPIACGWTEQYAMRGSSSIFDACNQPVYENYINKLHEAGLYPRCLIIDDKWMTSYLTDIADEKKWPDLREFVDARHSQGIHTMLWFKLFDPDKVNGNFIIHADNEDRLIDPSHPEYIKLLDDALYRILSSDEGCYDCDGLKVDFAFFNPYGRNFTTYSGKYGAELLFDYTRHIYEKAKEIKPYAIINCSPAHPYFAAYCDQARIHDYDSANRSCKGDMKMRAKIFSIAMPGVLIDTDGGGRNTRRDVMRFLLAQPEFGIPDIYCISPLPYLKFTEDDLATLSAVWGEYTDRIDAMYDDVK